nr:hypothetical protein [Tanacetum cinerariifolium]
KPHDESSSEVPEGSGNPNPIVSSSYPPADPIETLTVESPIPTVSSPVLTACLNDSPEPYSETRVISKRVANQEETPSLDNILSLTNRFKDILGVTTSSYEAIRVEADISNMETTISANTLIQTRHKSKEMEEQSFIATLYQKTDPALLQFCLFSCFLSQVEPKKKVKTLVDCPKGVRPIGTKWVLKNKKDERGIVVKNKARLVAQGHIQEEGIDYDELCREFKALMHKKFQMSVMGELKFFLGLQVMQKEDGIFLSQDKYIGYILKQFGFSDVRSSNTFMDKENPWGKDGTRKDGHPKLGLLYPKASPFDLVAFSNSNYGGASQDHKSTTGGSQFLGRMLISWQCKKQTIVATSTTEAEYVAAASCRGQVLWI